MVVARAQMYLSAVGLVSIGARFRFFATAMPPALVMGSWLDVARDVLFFQSIVRLGSRPRYDLLGVLDPVEMGASSTDLHAIEGVFSQHLSRKRR